MSKKIIYKENLGPFIKPCPGSPGRINCNYLIISPAMGCPYNCSYCFLNFYSKEKNICIFSNQEKMFQEFKDFINLNKNKLLRFGTGEFMDSLALKQLNDTNLKLIKFIKDKENVIIEFKTKSTNIDPFLNIEKQDNVILSWSLNPQEIIETEELLTPSLEERLNAIKKTIDYGYKVALHLDPIFMSEENLAKYLNLIDIIFKNIDSNKIAWFSMGGFRYTDELKLAILENSKNIKNYLAEEFIKCNDGKFRYPRYLRLKFYNLLGEKIKSKNPKIKLYMCMEDDFMWESIIWGKSSVTKCLHTKACLL
jgi:spore photoproduct lyase